MRFYEKEKKNRLQFSSVFFFLHFVIRAALCCDSNLCKNGCESEKRRTESKEKKNRTYAFTLLTLASSTLFIISHNHFAIAPSPSPSPLAMYVIGDSTCKLH